MLHVEYTTRFKKDVKLIKRRGRPLAHLQKVMKLLEAEKALPLSLRDHGLKGNWADHRECHIEPDWLLIYKIVPKEKVIIFVRTGTHADLF